MEESQPSSADILDFSKTRKTKRVVCWVCSLPERAAIDEAKGLGANAGDISEWLIAKRGYPRTEARQRRIKHHFDARHHLGE
jgi:hypothetical protein